MASLRSAESAWPLLIEGHDDDAGAVAADFASLRAESVLAFLEADGIDDALALKTLEAGLDDRPFRAVHDDGHARDVGLGAQCVQERGHGFLGVEHGLVHVDVDHLRAAFDLLAGDGQRRLVFALANQLGEARRAGHVGALADVDEVGVRANDQRLEAAEARVGFGRRRHAWRDVAHRFGYGANVRGRGAAAATGDVEEAAAREVAEIGGHALGRFVEAAEGVGQAGIRVADGGNRRQTGQLLEERTHLLGAERAVHSDGEQRHVRDGNPKGLDGLAGKRASAAIDDGDRSDDWHAISGGLEIFLDGEEGGLGIERIENRFEEQEVRAALDEGSGLRGVDFAQLVEGYASRGRIRDILRDRCGARGGAERSGDETAAIGVRGGESVDGAAGGLRACEVEVGDAALKAIIGHGDGIGVEGIGFDDVGAGFKVAAVDLFDDVRLSEVQRVVVEAQIARVIREFLAAVIGFDEIARLDHGAHGAIEHQDALAHQVEELGANLFTAVHD